MNNDINIIREYINLKKYKEVTEYLEKKIIQYLVQIIKEQKKDFKYTNIFNLIEASNKYIKDKRKYIAPQIRNYSEYIDDTDNVYRLMELCMEYNIL